MSSSSCTTNSLFVTCAQGLEPLLADELARLGGIQLIERFRGVEVEKAAPDAIYRMNYGSRLGSRVLLPLMRFRCRDRKDLYQAVADFNWIPYLARGKSLAIDANVQHPELRNSLFAAQVVKDAICDQLRRLRGDRPTINTRSPDIQLNLFIYGQSAVLSFDTSGEPLHKRGYRQGSVEAPMRESLAAALLELAEYRGEELLCDPCCGSGTLLVEAALIASKTAPGFLRRRWGFQELPNYCNQTWLRVKNEMDSQRQPLVPGRILGLEINRAAVQVCRANLRAAGVHQGVEILHRDFREYTPSLPLNLIVTNPPHGLRLESADTLKPLYRALGDWMKRNLAKPARAYVFTGDLSLAGEVGLASSQRHILSNGGVDSRLVAFEIW